MEHCDFCKNWATHRVYGWVEDTEGEGPVYSDVCEFHKREFEEWSGISELHGYIYIDNIEKIEVE